MNFKIGEYITCYLSASEIVTNAIIHRIDEQGNLKIEDLSNGNKLWVHSKQCRKIPKIFRDYKVGDKVHVFDCQGIYQGAGEVSSTSKSEAGTVEVIVKGVIGWNRLPLQLQPINLRKVKEK